MRLTHRESRPRVAVVSDYTLATVGGAENAFYEQVVGLSAVAEVVAICPPSARLTELGARDRITTLGVPVALIVPALGVPVARNTARLRMILRRAFRQSRVEVVHLHSEFGIAAAAAAAARELGIAVVHTVHTFFWQAHGPAQAPLAALGPHIHRWLTGLPQPRRRLAARPGDSALRQMTLASALMADRVISPSAHQALRLRQAGVRHVDVIPNTVRDQPAARPLMRIDGPLRVTWIGRLIAEKRILPFARAVVNAARVLGPGRLQVDILGVGPQERRLRELIRGTPSIALRGRIDHRDVPIWIAGGHLTALTSIGMDNQPMTVAESIMALRGVLWSDPALTEGVSAAGIPAFGSADHVLADKLIELCRDPTPVLAASAAAIEARAVFSSATFVESVVGSYRRAIVGCDRWRSAAVFL